MCDIIATITEALQLFIEHLLILQSIIILNANNQTANCTLIRCWLMPERCLSPVSSCLANITSSSHLLLTTRRTQLNQKVEIADVKVHSSHQSLHYITDISILIHSIFIFIKTVKSWLVTERFEPHHHAMALRTIL